jgi:hypothetical protein
MAKSRSHNDLPSNAKAASITVLNVRLADAIDLALLTTRHSGCLHLPPGRLHWCRIAVESASATTLFIR